MKSFYLLSSIGIAALLSLSPLKAEKIIPQGHPGLPSTYKQCLSMKGISEENGGMQSLIDGGGETGAGPVSQAWQELCEALQACEVKHSEDEYGWRECIFEAQGQYQQATNPDAALGLTPYQGEKLPVNTNEADSHYEKFDNNHKGYFNADVGG